MGNDKREQAWAKWERDQLGDWSAWAKWERDQLGDWSDVSHRQSFDAGHAAATAEAQADGWVAIETGLPEADGWYACTINDNDGFENLVEPYWFSTVTGFWSDGDNLSADAIWLNRQSLIAWQPMPAPYQHKSEGDSK